MNEPHQLETDLAYDPEAGFSILDLMVAIFILSLMSMAILSLLLSAMRVQTKARADTIAAQIAQRELEEIRSWEISDFTRIIEDYGGRYEPEPIVEGPFTFFRSIDVSWESNEASSIPGQPDYIRASVRITWNNMGSSPPVVMTTYITGPPCDPNTGHIEVRVSDHRFTPLADVRLDLFSAANPLGDTGYTSADGTFFFACVEAGTYELTGTLTGHIAKDLRDRAVIPGISVAINQVTTVEFQLAQPATLVARLVDAVTLQELTGTGSVSLARTDFGPLVVSGSSPISVSGLWPGDYSLAGAVYNCAGMGGFMSATVGTLDIYLDSGSTTATIALSPGLQVTLTVTVLGVNEQPVQGARVEAIDACGVRSVMPITGPSGESSRSGIRPGPYRIEVLPPSPYQPTFGDTIAATDPTRRTIVVSP